jgi:hypothetical protein
MLQPGQNLSLSDYTVRHIPYILTSALKTESLFSKRLYSPRRPQDITTQKYKLNIAHSPSNSQALPEPLDLLCKRNVPASSHCLKQRMMGNCARWGGVIMYRMD